MTVIITTVSKRGKYGQVRGGFGGMGLSSGEVGEVELGFGGGDSCAQDYIEHR